MSRSPLRRMTLCLFLAMQGVLLASCALAPSGANESESTGASESPATSSESKTEGVKTLLAQAYEQMLRRDDTAAEATLLRARRIDPTNAWVSLNLGVIYQRSGQYEIARTEYQAAILSSDGIASGKATTASSDAWKGKSVGEIARGNLAMIERVEASSSARPIPSPAAEVAASSDKPSPTTKRNVGGGHVKGDCVQADPLSSSELNRELHALLKGWRALKASGACPVVRPGKNEVHRELFERLEAWRSAWEHGDIDAYLGFYSNEFRGAKEDRRAWEAERRQRIAGRSDLRVGVEDASLIETGETAVFTFLQRYSSAAFNDVAVKELVWQRHGSKWLIVRENANKIGR